MGVRELNGTGTETVGESDRGEIAMGIAMENRVGERQRKGESLERESERERQRNTEQRVRDIGFCLNCPTCALLSELLRVFTFCNVRNVGVQVWYLVG